MRAGPRDSVVAEATETAVLDSSEFQAAVADFVELVAGDTALAWAVT